MANYTLTTSAQEVGRNTTPTVGARLLAWYSNASGNSAVVHLKLQAIAQGLTYTGTNKDYELYLDNTGTGVVSWSYAPLPADTWIDVAEITQSVAGGRTVNVSGKVWTYLYDDAWITGNTVTMPTLSTPPTGLAISDLTAGTESFNADVSITGWGTNPGSSKALELQCWTKGMNQPRRYQAIGTSDLSTNITVDNNSEYSTAYGPLTIVGNTEYTIGAYATNGNANTGSQNMGNAVTLAYPANLQPAITSDTTATIYYSIRADGGKYEKTYEYSLDDGTTWETFATVSSGSATSGSFDITGLSVGAPCTIKHRVTTTAGTNNGTDVTFTIPVRNKFYGSVSDEATRVNKMYGSVSELATHYVINYIANNPSLNTTIFMGKYYSTYGYMLAEPSLLQIVSSSLFTNVVLRFSNGTSKTLFAYSGAYRNQGSAWGFNSAPVTGSISYSSSTHTTRKARLVAKIYGSDNGEAKRIY